jgi:hypothetical protein
MDEMEKIYIINKNFSYSKWYSWKVVCLQMRCSPKGPLIPYVILFGFDLLQYALNDKVMQGTLCRPIETNDMDFPIIEYADIILLNMPTDRSHAVKETLEKYSMSAEN